MTTTHVHGLDRAVHKTNIWLKDIMEEAGWNNPERAYLALRNTLHAIRDRLLPEEAADLASQLPLLIRGVYYDGYRPTDKPEAVRTREEFLSGLQEAFLTDSEVEADDAARVVFAVMQRHITEGQMRHVIDSLPADIAELATSQSPA